MVTEGEDSKSSRSLRGGVCSEVCCMEYGRREKANVFLMSPKERELLSTRGPLPTLEAAQGTPARQRTQHCLPIKESSVSHPVGYCWTGNADCGDLVGIDFIPLCKDFF